MKIEDRIREIEEKLDILAEVIKKAVDYRQNDPKGSLTKSREVLEGIVLKLYDHLQQKKPKKNKRTLGFLLNNHQFEKEIPPRIFSRMKAVTDMSNLGPHANYEVYDKDAERVLNDLCDILDWYFEEYDEIIIDNGKEWPEKGNKKPLIAAVLISISTITSLILFFSQNITPDQRDPFFIYYVVSVVLLISVLWAIFAYAEGTDKETYVKWFYIMVGAFAGIAIAWRYVVVDSLPRMSHVQYYLPYIIFLGGCLVAMPILIVNYTNSAMKGESKKRIIAYTFILFIYLLICRLAWQIVDKPLWSIN